MIASLAFLLASLSTGCSGEPQAAAAHRSLAASDCFWSSWKKKRVCPGKVAAVLSLSAKPATTANEKAAATFDPVATLAPTNKSNATIEVHHLGPLAMNSSLLVNFSSSFNASLPPRCASQKDGGWAHGVGALLATLSAERRFYARAGTPTARAPPHTSVGSAEWSDAEWAVQLSSATPCDVKACVPLPAWAPPHLGMPSLFRRLPVVLRNRTIMFVGDSLTELFFTDLVWAIEFYNAASVSPLEPPVRSSLGPRRTRGDSRVKGGAFCSTWKQHAFSVCMQQAGRFGGLLRVPRHDNGTAICDFDGRAVDHDLGDVITCLPSLLPAATGGGVAGSGLRSTDILVVNTGLHHNEPNATLVANVRSFILWFQNQSSPPTVIWRESTPQHFATETGEWDTHEKAGIVCGRVGGICAAMNPLREKTEFQKYNNASTPMIVAAGIPIVALYQALAPYWHSHTGCVLKHRTVDCVHYAFPSPPLRFGNLATISLIQSELERRRALDDSGGLLFSQLL